MRAMLVACEIDAIKVQEIVFRPLRLLLQQFRHLRQSLRERAKRVDRGAAKIDVGRRGRGVALVLEDMRGHAGAFEVLIKGAPGIEALGWQTGAFQRLALLVACIRKKQGRNHLIDQRLVIMPFVDAALPNFQPGVDGGGVRGGGRGKLRGQFRDHALVEQMFEEAVARRVMLKKAPAKGIDKKQDDSVVARGQVAEHIWRQRAFSLAGKQIFDGTRNIREAIRIIQRSREVLRELCAVYRFHRGSIKHSNTCFLPVCYQIRPFTYPINRCVFRPSAKVYHIQRDMLGEARNLTPWHITFSHSRSSLVLARYCCRGFALRKRYTAGLLYRFQRVQWSRSPGFRRRARSLFAGSS